MNHTAYDAWIAGQLEPTSIIRTGNAKRHKPAFVEAWEAIAVMRSQMGEEEYQRRLNQDEADQQRYYEEQ